MTKGIFLNPLNLIDFFILTLCTYGMPVTGYDTFLPILRPDGTKKEQNTIN